MPKCRKKSYCCVPDMILHLAKNKKYALEVLSVIYDKIKRKQLKPRSKNGKNKI